MRTPILFSLVLNLSVFSAMGSTTQSTVQDSLVLRRIDNKRSIVIPVGSEIQLFIPKQPNPKAIFRGVKGDSIIFSKDKTTYIKHLLDIKRIRVYQSNIVYQKSGNTIAFVGKQALVVSGADLLIGTFYSIDKGFKLENFKHVPITCLGGITILLFGNRIEARSFRLHKKWLHHPTSL